MARDMTQIYRMSEDVGFSDGPSFTGILAPTFISPRSPTEAQIPLRRFPRNFPVRQRFLYALEIDQAFIAHTQMEMGSPKIFDSGILKFGLKFSVLAPITSGLSVSPKLPCTEKFREVGVMEFRLDRGGCPGHDRAGGVAVFPGYRCGVGRRRHRYERNGDRWQR